MRTPSAFQCLGPGASAAALEVLGLWTAVSTTDPGTPAFGEPSADCLEGDPLGRPGRGAAQIGIGEGWVERVERTIPTAFDRFAADLPGWTAVLPPGLTARPPEERLAALLAAAGDVAPVPAFGPGESVAFGVFHGVTRPFQDALEWVRKALLHYAWVETIIGGQLVARTVVGWTGNFSTRWSEGLDETMADLHLRCLGVAMDSRNAVL